MIYARLSVLVCFVTRREMGIDLQDCIVICSLFCLAQRYRRERRVVDVYGLVRREPRREMVSVCWLLVGTSCNSGEMSVKQIL